MTRSAFAHAASLPLAVPLALAALLGGCVTLSPSQIAAMSSVDLCEYQDVQGRNLTDDARRALQGELKRRNDDCRQHAAEVAQRREDVLDQLTYGRPDDP
ncbi:MAG: hypothetical protein ACXWUH_19560 [Burkholderiales bacterium]